MASNSLQRLQAAGIASGDLPEEVLDVLDELSAEEVDALISAKEKVTAAASEVEGFAAFIKLSGARGDQTELLQKASPDLGGRIPEASFDDFAHEGGFIF